MSATRSGRWFRRHVRAQLGNHEDPLGSNNTSYGRRFGSDGVSWCVIFGWCMYDDAGVRWPIKTASCVEIFDECSRLGMAYGGQHAVPDDAVIRTWQNLDRNSPGFDPEQTHFQIVVAMRVTGRVKELGLIGGNQGAGYVGPAVEWVRAGDRSILGALAFHRLFGQAQREPASTRTNGPLPATKSHKHPNLGLHKQAAVAGLTGELAGHKRPLPTGSGSGRGRLRRLAAEIRRLLSDK